MCNKVFDQDRNGKQRMHDWIVLCLALLLFDMRHLNGSLHHKRLSEAPAAKSEQPKQKKFKTASGAAVAPLLYTFNTLVPQIKFFPNDVWRIITAYTTVTGLVRRPITLGDPARIVRVEKERGKIVQTVLGNSGVVALRTNRGFVQAHSNTGQMILDASVLYEPKGDIELSDNEQMLHISAPERVWDLKTGKKMQGVKFDAHKTPREIMVMTSQSSEIILWEEEMIRITGVPAGHKAALEGYDRMIVIPYDPRAGNQRRGVQVFDQKTGKKILDLQGHRVRRDCFEHGGPLITSNNNQDLVWDNDRAIYRIDKKLSDTKISSSGDVLIGTNKLRTKIRVWNLAFSKTSLSVDQTIFLWVIDAFKTICNGAQITLSGLVKFCNDETVTYEEVLRVYTSFDPILKDTLIRTYQIVQD